jgi:hypothetical protein
LKPSTVIFRLDDETAHSVNANLLSVLAQTEDDLRAGALILVQDFATAYGGCRSLDGALAWAAGVQGQSGLARR